MAEEPAFDIIDALHDGVADDGEWLKALDRITDALGGAAIFLGSAKRSGTGFDFSGHRVDPRWIEMVNGELSGHEANPIYSIMSAALRADPVATVMRPIVLSSVLDPAEFRRSAIYTAAMKPAGYEFAMAMVLWADAASALSLTVVRTPGGGDFGEPEQRFAMGIGPHLLRTLRLRHRHAIARSAALMLDRFDHAVMLLTPTGRIVHANAEAEALLKNGDGLRQVNGELKGSTPDETRLLRQTVNETHRAALGASLVPQATLRLRRPSGRSDLVVRALPIAPVIGSTFGAGELATAALFVHEPDHERGPVEKLLEQGLGLSRAEAAVAARIFEGDTVSAAAERLGVSANTVKTHLKNIYEKLHIVHRSELVRRVAMMLATAGR